MLANIATVKKDVQRAISSLRCYLQKIDNIGTLKEIKSYITSAINLIRARQSIPQTFLATKTEVEKQRQFFQQRENEKGSCTLAETNSKREGLYLHSTSTNTHLYMVLTVKHQLQPYQGIHSVREYVVYIYHVHVSIFVH